MVDRLKSILSEIRDPYPRIRGACKMCGKCCHSLILTRKGKPIYTLVDFKKMQRWDPQTYHRFTPDTELESDRPLTFSCKYIDENNLCSDHENRPVLCQTYPHRSIFKIGAELEDGCGYRVVNKGDFEDILDRKIDYCNNEKV